MTQIMNIAETRQKLTQLPKQFGRHPELAAIEVTSRGKPVMALMPWGLYESILETLDVMGDPELMKTLRESIDEVNHGRTIPWSKAKARLKL